MSDFLLDLRRSLAHKGFAKILYISTGMPACPVECKAYSSGAVFANPYASRYQYISSQKIAQLRLKNVQAAFSSPLFQPFEVFPCRDHIRIQGYGLFVHDYSHVKVALFAIIRSKACIIHGRIRIYFNGHA